MDLYQEIEKTFPMLEKMFAEEKITEFRNTPKDDLGKYDFGMGTMIRLKILRQKSYIYKCFLARGFKKRNKMSAVIIERFHAYITNKYPRGAKQGGRPMVSPTKCAIWHLNLFPVNFLFGYMFYPAFGR